MVTTAPARRDTAPENTWVRRLSESKFELIELVDGTYVVQLASAIRASYAASFSKANRFEGTTQLKDAAQLPLGTAPRYLVKYQGGEGQAINVRRPDPPADLP